MKRNVGILVFDNVEVLDFAGPFEVFSVTSQLNNFELFNVFIVSKTLQSVKTINGLSVNPDYDFTNHPKLDILIVAGGQGTRTAMKDQTILQWVRQQHTLSEITMSICSGARILGALGFLDQRPYCTHHEVYDHMQEVVPTGKAQKDKRFVQSDARLYTSGGITAGIDLSFFIVQKLSGHEIAEKTSIYMEYDRKDS